MLYLLRAAAFMAACLAIVGPAEAAEPNAGYYGGLATTYPYAALYCHNDSEPMINCRRAPGGLELLPKSAPLPPSEKWCVWADVGSPASIGSSARDAQIWYQWAPREVPKEDQWVLGARVCYWADRGKAKTIEYLAR